MTVETATGPGLSSVFGALIEHLTRFRLPEPASVGWRSWSGRVDMQPSESADRVAEMLRWAHTLPEPEIRLWRAEADVVHLHVSGRLAGGYPVRLFTRAPERLVTAYAARLAVDGTQLIPLTALHAA